MFFILCLKVGENAAQLVIRNVLFIALLHFGKLLGDAGQLEDRGKTSTYQGAYPPPLRN